MKQNPNIFSFQHFNGFQQSIVIVNTQQVFLFENFVTKSAYQT